MVVVTSAVCVGDRLVGDIDILTRFSSPPFVFCHGFRVCALLDVISNITADFVCDQVESGKMIVAGSAECGLTRFEGCCVIVFAPAVLVLVGIVSNVVILIDLGCLTRALQYCNSINSGNVT